jgi:hypothetical protein
MLKTAVMSLAMLAAAESSANPGLSPQALIDAVQKAEQAGDVTTLAKLVSPAFAQHHASGTVEPRSAWLADRSSSQSNPTVGRTYLERDIQWRYAGHVAVRTSIARIRGAKPGTDIWVRSTAVVEKEKREWHLLDLDSALLLETPAYDGPLIGRFPDGRFGSKAGGTFRFAIRGGLPHLFFDNGREIPLIAIGPDLYWCGSGSTLTMEWDADGQAAAVTRHYGEKVAWRATPMK